MKDSVKVGSAGEVQFVVEPAHTITFAASNLPPILSTPSLIWFLEHAAIEALKPALEPHEVSVGTNVEVQHLAPTPVGLTVRCTAKVVQSDGPSYSFHVEAHDGKELIARGYHQRRIIRAESFAKKILSKKV